MTPNTNITVQLVGENLLAFLGEKADEPAPEAVALDSPRLVADLETAPSKPVVQTGPFLQTNASPSARRPLFAPAAGSQEKAAEAWSPEPRPASATESKQMVSAPDAGSNGLVLYQAPPVGSRALWLAAAGIVLVLSGFSAYAYSVSRHPQSLATGSQSLAKISPLKLQLESRDHALVGIRWDPQSSAVGRASSGRLLILEDGAQTRIVPLDADQLKIGHLYYDSAADRVEFRLEVIDGAGAVTTESLLAVALPKRNKLDAANTVKPSAPPTQNTPAVTHVGDSLRAVSQDSPAENANGLAVLASLPPTFNHFAPPPAAASTASTPASLLHRVAPVYPSEARAARVSGTVLFTATITKDGKVANLQPISGNPMLMQAAIDAAKQWLYRPTMQNGRPIEALTQIAIDFSLN